MHLHNARERDGGLFWSGFNFSGWLIHKPVSDSNQSRKTQQKSASLTLTERRYPLLQGFH
jgi:hypothetical protein